MLAPLLHLLQLCAHISMNTSCLSTLLSSPLALNRCGHLCEFMTMRSIALCRRSVKGEMHAQVMDFLGSAAFSRAVQALDVKTRRLVCLKIIKNNKDYFDQSLDEIKLLSYINNADPMDEHGLLRLYDYFYYKVCPAASC